ncbi:MAG: hypothetical protein IJS57_03070 [Paludibacteraceae bacterium]|nr:hypothetical protein [Paludibacteraceae bacterium]
MAWYFLRKKTYYVHIESAGENADGIVEVFKTQLETTLEKAFNLSKQIPRLVRAGNLLNAYTLVRAIRKAGGNARITYHWAWQKPLKGQDDYYSQAYRDMGEVDLTADDFAAAKESANQINLKAYAKMAEVMEIGGENFYPETLEQTQQMSALLDEAEQAAKDKEDPVYRKMLNELRGIVGWPKRRHFNFSWFLILGSIVTLGFMQYFSNRDTAARERAETNYRSVKAWNLKTDTITVEEAFRHNLYTDIRYQSPNFYRAAKMAECMNGEKSAKQDVDERRLKLASAQTEEERKTIQKGIDYWEKVAQKRGDERIQYEQMNFKELQKDALKYTKGRFGATREDQYKTFLWYLFFILLIPLYVIANYSYGYTITRHRTESKILSTVHKWLVTFGISLIGAGWIMQLLPDRLETYFDSVTGKMGTRLSPDPTNFVMIFIKLGLILLGLIVIAVSSSAIMLYSTFVGLRRNYNWKTIIANLKTRMQK